MPATYAELHCHTNFSFLDGASTVEDLVQRAVELEMPSLAVTDHDGLYGVVRFALAAEAAGIHPVLGVEIELLDAAVPDPHGIVVPSRRAWRPGGSRARGAVSPEAEARSSAAAPEDGLPARPRPSRMRLPGHRRIVKEDLRGIGERQRGPHLVLLARDATGYRSLCRLLSRANLNGTKRVPQIRQNLLVDNAEGLVLLSGCRESEIARRLRVGDREGAAAVTRHYAALFGRGRSGEGPATSSCFLELSHHLLPDDDWLVGETAALADEVGLPVVVTNDVHYARPEDRELADVMSAIFHGRTLDTLADLRRLDGESYLKSAAEMAALPPGTLASGALPSGALAAGADPRVADARVARRWAEGIATSGELAATCSVELGFEKYRFPGFDVPQGETAFSYLVELCQAGVRRRYHPVTPSVVRQLAHELDVIEKTGLAEFFLICWDLMRFAKEKHIPAQGRGSAADSIVAYALGITRVDPIRHNLLFERFINEGRTTYPDVDIDFSSERREEVIQYVYGRYGEAHTGMVCNLVTYRARSAVREIGYALGFPRPLVDRVAKALETYDSVMVRRDLESDGGFADFFRRPGEPELAAAGAGRAPDEDAVLRAAALSGARGLTDAMGQLNHARGGRISTGGRGERGDGRLPRPEDAARVDGPAPDAAPALDAALTPDAAPALDAALTPDPDSALDAAPTPDADSAPDVPLSRQIPTPGRQGQGVSTPAGRIAEPGAQFIPNRTWVGMHSTGQGLSTDPTSGNSDPKRPPMSIWPTSHSQSGGPGPSASGMWEEAPESPPAIRPGRNGDDEGGPGDTPASVAWLRAGRGTGYGSGTRSGQAPRPLVSAQGTVGGRAIDPESGALAPPGRRTDGEGRAADRLGRPNHWDPPAPAWNAMGRGGSAAGASAAATGASAATTGASAATGASAGTGASAAAGASAGTGLQRHEPHSSVARLEAQAAPEAKSGSTKRMSDWERWLELCARIDGFPRHLSIHSGGMLVTAAPLIDIAPIERATMKDRVVVQFDKRDVESLKLIKLDLLGLGMLAAIDETLQLIEHDCALCIDLDRMPEDIPEVFTMLQAADTVGVFQVESRAQMQTLPKSRPTTLDDLVVEVAIIRPGPIQGNAVHPYLRRKQGLEPVTYLHPSLEPILGETMGVILYQEQVMKVAIEVAGFTPAESDGFRRAMGTWRSNREMEKLHAQFHDGCMRQPGMTDEIAEELFRQVSAFASFGFAKSHAAAFARTAYESAFLKLFYPAQFLVGLINAQPMGFYPVEVLVNDTKRHGVTVLPVDINASGYRTTTEWVGEAGPVVDSPACVVPGDEARQRWAAESAMGWGVRLGLHLVKGIGEQHQELLDRELARGPYASLADVMERTGLPEETIERLIRTGALDSLGRPRRELLWQLREVAGASRGRVDGKALRVAKQARGRKSATAGRPMDLRLPATDAPELPPITEVERLGDAYAVVGLDAKRQVIELFRPSLDAMGVVTAGDLATRRPGPVRIAGLVVTRQHPMTARGTVFLAVEDETGMGNVTLWPDTWARLRAVVRRHALLLIDGDLQRESSVVNVVATEVRSLTQVVDAVAGREGPEGVRQLGHAGMRRLG
jgi:DNA polymerase III alpha subunit